LFGSNAFGKQHGSCRSYRSTSAIDVFLSSMMAKNPKRKRDQDETVEKDEVRIVYPSFGSAYD
jgi:hypothetical protein